MRRKPGCYPQLDVVLSCEHAGNVIPAAYRRLFAAHQALLQTHRGVDWGAMRVAQQLAKHLKVPLVANRISRLLVDTNRSLHHRGLFSEISRVLDEQARAEVLALYYQPHRHAVMKALQARLQQCQTVLHMGVHSFTPTLNHQIRLADIGLLYDSKRSLEALFCRALKQALVSRLPKLRVRYNYPYRGCADGLTTALRKKFSTRKYLGIELEMNQAWLLYNQRTAQGIIDAICASMEQVLPYVGQSV